MLVRYRPRRGVADRHPGDLDPDLGQPEGSFDDWAGQLTLSGFDTQDVLTVAVDMGALFTDPAFFKNELTSFIFQNLSLLDPFNSVDPSFCFTDAAGGTAVSDCSGVTGFELTQQGVINAVPGIAAQADADRVQHAFRIAVAERQIDDGRRHQFIVFQRHDSQARMISGPAGKPGRG